MENQQGQGSGSDWQRQAVIAARSNVPTARAAGIAASSAEAAGQRAEAQNVPDMLAAVDPQPVRAQPQVQPQTPAAIPAPPQGSEPERPVFGDMSNDVPVAGTPVTGTGGRSAAMKFLVGLVVLLVVAGAGAGGYFLFFSGSNNAGPSAKDSNQQQNANAVQSVALESLAGASLIAPANIAADYDDVTEKPDGFFFTYQSKADACSIVAGIAPQDKLSAALQSKTTDQIVELWMQAATFDGTMAVARTNETGTLTLLDADDSKKGYTLPTVYYTATSDAGVEHYAQSMAKLKDGRLAMIVRWCGVLEGDADAILAKHDAKVLEFTIRLAGNSP